jgi:hypothetical protein
MTGRRDDSQELPRFSADAEMIRRPVTLGNVARNPSGARFAVGPPNKFEMLQLGYGAMLAARPKCERRKESPADAGLSLGRNCRA